MAALPSIRARREGKRLTIFEIMAAIARGMATTLLVTICAMALSFVIGLVIAVLSVSRFWVIRAATYSYIQIFRGVPLLAQLFVLYFGLTRLGISLDSFSAAVIGLSLGGGAIIAETLRAGLSAVPAGQMEAAVAVGMTRFQAVRIIIMPQAAPLVMAPLSDFFVTLMKITAIASAVAAPEMTFQAKMVAQNTSQTTEVYLVLAGMYLLLSLPLIYALDNLEKRRTRGRGRA